MILIFLLTFVNSIVITQLGDYFVPYNEFEELTITSNLYGLAIMIHSKSGFTAEIKDEYDDIIKQIIPSNPIPLVSFGNHLGSIKITKNSPTSSNFYFSATFFSYDLCNGVISVSTGPSNKFILAASTSKYYYERNLTYDVYQQYCIWHVAPSSFFNKITYDTEYNYDFLSYYNTPNLENEKLNLIQKLSGSGYYEHNSTNSSFFSWISDSIIIKNHFIIESSLSDTNFDYTDYHISSYSFYFSTEIVTIPPEIKQITYTVNNMADYSISFSDFQQALIQIIYPNTSIAIHSSQYYSADFYDSDDILITTIKDSTFPKLFDYSLSNGYIIVKKLSGLLSTFYFSSIIYGFSSIPDCSSKRAISTGLYTRLSVASSKSELYEGRNLSFSNESVCYWVTSPIFTLINLDLTLSYFNKINGHVNLDYYYEFWATGTHMLDGFKSYFFDWQISTMLPEDKSFIIKGLPLNTYDIPTNIFSSSIIYDYNHINGIPKSIETIFTYEIKTMGDFSIDIKNVNLFQLNISQKYTSIVFHNKFGYNVTIESDIDPIFNDDGNLSYLIDFCSSIGLITVKKTSETLQSIEFSTMIWSSTTFPEVAEAKRIIQVGGSHDFIIASPISTLYNQRDVVYKSNQSLAIWIVSHSTMTYTIDTITENGYDVLYMFTSTSQTDHNLKNPSRFSGASTNTFDLSNSALFWWTTDDQNVLSHASIKANVKTPSNVERNTYALTYYAERYSSIQLFDPNSFPIYPESSYGNSTLTIDKFNDWVINFTDTDTLLLNLPLTDTLLIFHNKKGFDIQIVSNPFGTGYNRNEGEFIHFPTSSGIVKIVRTHTSYYELRFTSIVYSILPFSCQNDKAFFVGGNSRYIQFFDDSFEMDMSGNATYFEGDIFCLLYASASPVSHTISGSTYPFEDGISGYIPETKSDIPKNAFSLTNNFSAVLVNTNGSLLMRWVTSSLFDTSNVHISTFSNAYDSNYLTTNIIIIPYSILQSTTINQLFNQYLLLLIIGAIFIMIYEWIKISKYNRKYKKYFDSDDYDSLSSQKVQDDYSENGFQNANDDKEN